MVEIVSFREAMKGHAASYESPSWRVHHPPLRRGAPQGDSQNAQILVAFGSCATLGGINMLKNFQEPESVRRFVYGDQFFQYETIRPAAEAVVAVDVEIHGCPVNRREFHAF